MRIKTYAVVITDGWAKDPIAYFLYYQDAETFINTFWPNKGKVIEVEIIVRGAGPEGEPAAT